MIKDVFTFKKDSWHMSLMTYIWGYKYYDFRNMCPYFWLSVFNVLIAAIPVITIKTFWLLLKLLRKKVLLLLDTISNVYDDYCYRQDEIWREKIRAEVAASIANPKEGDILDKWIRNAKLRKSNPFWIKMDSKLINLIDNFIDWNDRQTSFSMKTDEPHNVVIAHSELQKLFNERKDRWEAIEHEAKKKKKEREEQEYLAKAARAKRIGQLTTKIKASAKWIAAGLLLFASYWLFKLVKLIVVIVSNWNWSQIIISTLFVLKIAIIAIFAVIAAAIICFILAKTIKFLWCKYGKYCTPCEERKNVLAKFFIHIIAIILYLFVNIYPTRYDQPVAPGPISLFFIWCWRGIREFWSILMALKKDNCPAIEWED